MAELADGKYLATAKAWFLTEVGEKNTPEVAVEFLLLEPGLGTITWDGWLTEAAFDRTVESLRRCGWTGDDLTDLKGLDASQVELVVENEEYQGKMYPRVKWVNKPGGISVKTPMAADKVKAFAASMRDRIRALDASQGKRAPAQKPAAQRIAQDRRPEPPPITDSDLPF